MKYATLKEAHNALKLDAGFDPFLHHGVTVAGIKYAKLSKKALAAAGYIVDPTVQLEIETDKCQYIAFGCRECGKPSTVRQDCSAHGIGNCGLCKTEFTGWCKDHRAQAQQGDA